jgi:hypothetical protein
MPPDSISEGPAADAVSTQLWTVNSSGDTTEIDLGGAVIDSSDTAFLCAVHGESKPWSSLLALEFARRQP